MSVQILIATLLLAAGLFGQCPVVLSVNPSSIPAGSPNTFVNFTGNSMQSGDQALFLPPGSQTPVQLNAAITPPNQGSATIPANLLTNSGTAQFILFRQNCQPSSVNIQITPPQQPQCPSLSSSSPSTFTATSANVNLTLSGMNLAAG